MGRSWDCITCATASGSSSLLARRPATASTKASTGSLALCLLSAELEVGARADPRLSTRLRRRAGVQFASVHAAPLPQWGEHRRFKTSTRLDAHLYTSQVVCSWREPQTFHASVHHCLNLSSGGV